MDPDDVGALGLEGRGPGHEGGPVRAVEDDLDAVQADRGADAVDEVRDVGLDEGEVVADPADAATGRAGPRLAEPGLDRVLDGVVELDAAAGEELDPVVGHRVVAGRQHDAEVGLLLAGQEGDARGRQHAEADDVDAGAGQPGHDRGLQELPGGTRVATHDRERPVTGELAGLAQHVRGGDGQVEGELGGQLVVRTTTHPVGAEETTHEISVPDATRRERDDRDERDQRLLY